MLYGRYHGKILGLAIRSGADGAWRAELREILAEFDNDCRDLSRFSNYLLHRELLRPKSSMRCCAFPIPISKQFLP